MDLFQDLDDFFESDLDLEVFELALLCVFDSVFFGATDFIETFLDVFVFSDVVFLDFFVSSSFVGLVFGFVVFESSSEDSFVDGFFLELDFGSDGDLDDEVGGFGGVAVVAAKRMDGNEGNEHL